MGNQTFEAHWQAVRAHLLKKADDMAFDAGMSGSFNDGGAEALRQRVKAFDAGVARMIPDEWERMVAPLMDPEYATFQRLKAKFEGRR